MKSYHQVMDLLRPLGVLKVEQVHSTQSMIRYFIHADHKEKAQYSKDDITAYNGADIDNIFIVNDVEIYGILKDMITCIDDNDIDEYSSFVRLCMSDEFYTKWFPLVVGKYQYFILNYIKSKRFAKPPNQSND